MMWWRVWRRGGGLVSCSYRETERGESRQAETGERESACVMSAVEGFFAITEYIYPLSMLEGLALTKQVYVSPPYHFKTQEERSQA